MSMKPGSVSKFPFCPESNFNAALVLAGFALVTSMLLVSNPGYFSHDELQKLDAVRDLGLWNYIRAYVNFPDYSDFSVPVRPFSYFVQGLVAASGKNMPFMMHLADVLMHAAVGILLFIGVFRVTGKRKLAWLAALIFLVSPNAAFAVGWSAALMDRLFILFGLVSCLAAYQYVSRNGAVGSLSLLMAGAILSVCSKETGIVLPTLILGYLFVSPGYLKNRKFWIALAVWSLPSLAMLAYRSAPLLHSIAGKDAAYSVDFSAIPVNVLVYVAYPFLPDLYESYTWTYLVSQTALIAAFAAHIVLTVMLWRKFSLRVALAYDAAYLLFLLPVITLTFTASHYLYASGIPLSLAMGALLAADYNSKATGFIARAFVLILLAVATVHNFRVQNYIYDIGTCSKTAMSSATSVYLSLGAPEEMTIVADIHSSAQVPMRIFHDRDRLGEYRPIRIKTLNWNDPDAGPYKTRFDVDCVVYTEGIEEFKVKSWAPQTTYAGKVVNEQPDGSMGIWIKVTGEKALGEVEVLFDGTPAKVTSRQPGLITAAISPQQISEPGVKIVALRSMATGDVTKVGEFEVVEAAN